MSGERIVTIPVTDDAVHYLRMWPIGDGGQQVGEGVEVPVPPDDQLAQDLERVTSFILSRAGTLPCAPAAERLRAHFHLDES